jgi:hypothetical protein
MSPSWYQLSCMYSNQSHVDSAFSLNVHVVDSLSVSRRFVVVRLLDVPLGKVSSEPPEDSAADRCAVESLNGVSAFHCNPHSRGEEGVCGIAVFLI